MSDVKNASALPDGTLDGTELVVVQVNPNARGPKQKATTASIAGLVGDVLVKTANADLSAERVVTDTTSITVDWATAGQAKFNVASQGVTLAMLARGTNQQTIVANTGAAPTYQTLGAATAAMVASVRSAHVRYVSPIAPAANAGAATLVVDVVAADGAQIIAAQPDFPRKVLLFITDADSSISAGTLDLVGVGTSGEVVAESIALTGGTASKKSTKAYATITSATVAGLVGGDGVNDKIALGVDSALGLVGQKTPASSTFAVYKTDVNSVNEAVGTVDATAGTVDPGTEPDGTFSYDFWYTFAVTEVQSAHSHTFA